MQIIETGDSVNKGLGFFSIDRNQDVRSLIGFFYNIERKDITIEILYIRIKF